MSLKTVTVKQIQKLDKIAIEKYGVPSIALMENAGRAVTCEVLKRYFKGTSRRARTVCVLCGLGNNAGDGFVVARHLINAKFNVKVFIIGKTSQLKNDAAVNYKILKKIKHPIVEMSRRNFSIDIQDIYKNILKSDVIVDAIFGVGLNRDIQDPFKSVIELLNKIKKPIVAVDTPSGLDGTTGQVYGVCVKAKTTVTFSFAKKGFSRQQGPKHVGKVVIVDIGIPRKLIEQL